MLGSLFFAAMSGENCEYESAKEVLDAASTRFEVVPVDWAEVSRPLARDFELDPRSFLI
jgi:hypothetical protein